MIEGFAIAFLCFLFVKFGVLLLRLGFWLIAGFFVLSFYAGVFL